MNTPAVLLASIAISWLAVPSEGQRECEDDGAVKNNGQVINLCATMVGGVYLGRMTRQPTLLYFEPAFADHIFNAVIYGEDRAKFGAPEKRFLGKMTCVKGVLNVTGDRAEMVLTEPGQIREEKEW